MTKFKQNLLKLIPMLFLSVLLLSLIGCTKNNDLNRYVSEKKSEIYYCEQDGFTLTASYSQKEYPYCADGIVGQLSDLFEVKLEAPDNAAEYNLKFTINEKEYGGEMSFESVRQVYTFSQSIACPDESQIAFTVTDGKNETVLTATSVKTEQVLSPEDILARVQKAEAERLSPLWQNNTFAGEIYLRLTYKEGECFYFAAITDRNGNTYSMLIDAKTGEILASRENR